MSGLLLGSILIGGAYFFVVQKRSAQEVQPHSGETVSESVAEHSGDMDTPSTPDYIPPKSSPQLDFAPLLLPADPYPVPFIVQAPTGDWSRSEFQNGCEEAATLMVASWRAGLKAPSQDSARELIALARFEERMLGQAVDTDAETTQKFLLDQYFHIDDSVLEYDFSLEELRQALGRGVVIVPTNGRALGNPNFTRPGPLQHMLVLIGYDTATHEFITQDPGTRQGAHYRYSETTLFAALRDYPTGEHLPLTGERRAMIIVPPKPTDDPALSSGADL